MEILNEKTIRTAKSQHICDLCGMPINIGEKYENTVIKNENIYAFKNHKKCYQIAVKLEMFDFCDDGLTTNDFKEAIDTEYRNFFKIEEQSFKQRLHSVLSYHLIKS